MFFFLEVLNSTELCRDNLNEFITRRRTNILHPISDPSISTMSPTCVLNSPVVRVASVVHLARQTSQSRLSTIPIAALPAVLSPVDKFFPMTCSPSIKWNRSAASAQGSMTGEGGSRSLWPISIGGVVAVTMPLPV